MRTCKRPRGAPFLAIRNEYWILALIFFLARSGGRVWAQTPDPDDCLSTERILQRYADALGGQATLEGINTRIAEAEALEPSFKPGHPEKRKYVFEWKAPDKLVFKNRTAIFNTYTFKFDGKLLWTTMRGKPVLVGGNGEGNSPFYLDGSRNGGPADVCQSGTTLS